MSTHTQPHQDHFPRATVEADPALPAVHITRDFAATADQLVRAHTDPELFARWAGPTDMTIEIDQWDARSGGSYRYLNRVDGDPAQEYAFRGCFHTVRPDRLVQTLTFEGYPDAVSLETMTFTDLGDGRTRLHGTSLFDSFESRDGMIAAGMETGLQDGYDALDRLLTARQV